MSASTSKNRNGAASIEFAMVATVLFLFVAASFEFSRISIIRHVIDNASYEACRVVIVPGATIAEAQTRADSVLAKYGISNAIVTVTPNPILETSGNVTVAVTVPADQNRWGFGMFSAGKNIMSSTTLLTERTPIDLHHLLHRQCSD
jgi:Flp pilus assembly protein TadG